MISTNFSKKVALGLLAVGALCIAFTLTASGQVQTKTTTAPEGAPTKTIKVERGTVVYVSGNSCVIKAEDGTLRHFDNVPDSVTVTVDGKQLNIHQIQPGMVIERQTITTNTPRMITTVQTVTGTVWQVNPPSMVILTLEDGKNQKFTIPKGQKFTVDGQETDAFGLRKGMKIDAQKIVEQPENVVTQQIKRTGIAPPPPPAPKPDVPMLVVFVPVQEAPAPVEVAAAEPAPKQLPKTASDLPLIGLLGLLFCGVSLSVTAVRSALARIA
jgi:RNase P/RNase MRP subunit p29